MFMSPERSNFNRIPQSLHVIQNKSRQKRFNNEISDNYHWMKNIVSALLKLR